MVWPVNFRTIPHAALCPSLIQARLGRALALMAIFAMATIGSVPLAFAQSNSVPSFELMDQHGRRFTQAELVAKPSVIHFGFTSCPVICPTTLYEVGTRMRELGPLADGINFVFVTVDPERDTVAHLKSYIESFDSRIVGLSGDKTQIGALAAWVGATFSKIENGTGDYTMDHSVNAFLIARGGKAVSPLYMGDNAKEQAVMQALRALAASERS
jgi:protein SCO1